MITLGKEIKVIEDYVELEKIRHGSRLEVNFTCEVHNQIF